MLPGLSARLCNTFRVGAALDVIFPALSARPLFLMVVQESFNINLFTRPASADPTRDPTTEGKSILLVADFLLSHRGGRKAEGRRFIFLDYCILLVFFIEAGSEPKGTKRSIRQFVYTRPS